MDEQPDGVADGTRVVTASEITPEQVGVGSNAAAARVGPPATPALPRLLSLRDLLLVPPKEWLVEGMLQQGDLAVLYGPSGDGKTFVALDMALCVASGLPWHRHAVRSGSVVYLAAEGAQGLRNRVRAWAGSRLDDPTDPLWRTFHCIAEAVQLRTDLDGLIAVLTALEPKPSLIVVDTMARCIVGLEENSAKEMGEALHACGRLQQATGANVQLVHHTGKGDAKDVERGSSALRAAADSMILVRRDDGGVIHVKVTKQKEAEGGEHVALKLDHVDLGPRADGTRESSCRLSLNHRETEGAKSHPELNDRGLKLCLTLKSTFFEDGATGKALSETSELSRATFYREVKLAVEQGYIDRKGTGAQTRYVLLPKFQWEGVA
jgi:hypothetical protein